jgi:hypothetical protein
MAPINDLERVSLPPKPKSNEETFFAKFQRKVMENPLVLPVFGVTIYSVIKIFTAAQSRDKIALQAAQRLKLSSQFIVIALVSGGSYLKYIETKKQEAKTLDNNDQ